MDAAHPTFASFWDFSLAVYADPAVAQSCLALQDAGGVDVNMALFVLWQGVHGRRLSLTEVHAMDDHVARWREEIVRPLRGVRRSLKQPAAGWPPAESETLRSRIKREELEAERLQQAMLETAFPRGAGEHACDARDALAANLLAYARLIDSSAPEDMFLGLSEAVAGRVAELRRA